MWSVAFNPGYASTAAGLRAATERAIDTAPIDTGRRGPGRRAAASGPVALVRRARPEVVPLAPAQERMWSAGRCDGDWNVARALRIRGGAVDVAALVAAIGDVVARHAPLRTRYPGTGHGAVQVVGEPGTAPAVGVCAVGEAQLPMVLREFCGRGFELAAEPPIRARVLLLGERDVVLALVIHHIAVDGRSVAPLLRDLTAAYAARAAGSGPRWAPLPVDYVDYTLWKHAQLGDFADPWSRASHQLRYWANALAGRPCQLALPFDRPRPPRPGTAGAAVAVSFDARVHRRLLERAQRARSSVFMVLQAAFALSVGAIAHCPDVTVATAVSGRDHRLLDDLIGNFAADVLLRVRLDRAEDVDDLLAQVRRLTLAAFAHPDVPNPRLKRCLLQGPEHPLFQATLILQRNMIRPTPIPGALSVVDIPTHNLRAKHDLEFALTEHYRPGAIPSGIDGSLIYPTALFDHATATAFAERFTATVELLADGYAGGLRPLLAATRVIPARAQPRISST